MQPMYKPASLIEALEKRAYFSVTLGQTGLLSITGSDASDTLSFARDASQVNVTLNNTTTSFAATAIAAIEIDLGGGADTASIDPRVIDVDTTVRTGGGTDQLTVLGGPRRGELTLIGDNADTLTVTLDGVTDIIRLGDGTIVREGAFSLDPALVYSGFTTLNLIGGTQQDEIVIEAVPAGMTVNIETGEGNDQVRIGDHTNGIVANVDGSLVLDLGIGDDEIEIDDAAGTTSVNYHVLSASTKRDDWASITYTGLESLAIVAGQAQDKLWVDQQPWGYDVSFHGGAPYYEDGTDWVYINFIDEDGLIYTHLGWVPNEGYFARVDLSTGERISFAAFEEYALLQRNVGTVYDDQNQNGVRDAGEPGVSGIEIEQRWGAGVGKIDRQTVAITDADGRFVYDMFGPPYALFAKVPQGWYQVTPKQTNASDPSFDLNSGFYPPYANAGGIRNHGDIIGLTTKPSDASLSGIFFVDSDSDNWLDADELRVEGIRVWLDYNENGVLDPEDPWTLSDADGRYKFTNVQQGQLQFRVDLGTNYTTRQGTVVIEYGKQYEEGWNALKTYVPPNTYWGHIYHTIKNQGGTFVHKPLAGVRAYVDANNNGKLDSNEKSALSDVTGTFVIPGTFSPARRYVRVIVPQGYDVVGPGWENVYLFENLPVHPCNFGFIAQTNPSNVRLVGFIDYDGDGVKDFDSEPVDPGLGNLAWIDLNDNGVRDDPSAPYYLPPGTYRVRIEPRPNEYTPTNMTDGYSRLITIPAGQNIDVMIGFKPRGSNGSIAGRAFFDTNKNGVKDAAESWTSSTLYLDRNDNGVFDVGHDRKIDLSSGGSYLLENLMYGDYIIRWLAPTSVRNATVTSPVDGVYYLTLDPDQQVTGIDFGIWYTVDQLPAGSISGSVFYDADKDGSRDAGEAGIVGRTIWLDQDNDLQVDENERVTTTDVDGNYLFLNLENTTYKIRQVVPLGWQQTWPLNGYGINATISNAANVVVKGFGVYSATGPGGTATAAGWMFFDDDKDGVEDAGEARQSGKIVYIDANNNAKRDSGEKQVTTNAKGEWSFTNLAPGTYIIRREVPSGYYVSTPVIQITLAADQVAAGLKIGTAQGKPPVTPPPVDPPPTDPPPVDPPPTGVLGSISGYLFWDANANTIQDSGETRQAGKTVYLDLDNDGSKDSDEPSTTTDSDGEFSFTGLASRTYVVRRTITSGYWVTTPLIQISLNGQSVTNQKIGTAPGSGTQPPPVTDPVDPPPVNPPPVDPPPAGSKGSISGFLFNDTDGDGVVDSGEGRASGRVVYIDTNNNGKLDAGEKQTTTNTQGIFMFTGLDAGLYRVRRVFPTGYRQSTDLLNINLTAGQTIDDALIGSTARLLISGQVSNADTAAGIASRRVYVDVNGNGKYDSGEKSVFTDSGGTFEFFDLVAGTYKIRADVPSGWTSVNAAVATLTLKAAASHTTTVFSQRLIA